MNLKFSHTETALAETKLHVFRPEHSDDTVLWNAFRAGDEQALVVIFDKWVNPLHNYGVRMGNDSDVVKDAIQELFIDLWRTRAQLGETNSIKYYLLKSIRRKLVKIKSKKSNANFVPFSHNTVGSYTDSFESELIARQDLAERENLVRHLLESLTPRQREAVYLRFLEEMDYEKIAVIMEMSRQAVYNLINRSILSLKTAFR